MVIVMKAIEFRNMTADELNVRMGELKGELFNLRFQNATNQLDNPMKIVEVRRNIARVKTVQRELELRKNA